MRTVPGAIPAFDNFATNAFDVTAADRGGRAASAEVQQPYPALPDAS